MILSDDLYDEPVAVERTTQALESTGIAKRHQEITFDYIENKGVPKAIERQYDIVKKYTEEMDDNIRKGVGLFLKGGVGTLKTTLAIAVLKKAMEKNVRVRFVPMVSLVDRIMNFAEPSERYEFEQAILTTPMLVLDDLGAEMSRDWVVGKIDSIITERYNRMLPTIITTNLNTDELKRRYNERTLDRLKECSIGVLFNSPTLRCGVNK